MTFDAVTELGALLCRVYGDHGKWGRRQRALLKRRRIAARLAEVRMRTVAWRLAGTGWTPGGGEQPLWVTP